MRRLLEAVVPAGLGIILAASLFLPLQLQGRAWKAAQPPTAITEPIIEGISGPEPYVRTSYMFSPFRLARLDGTLTFFHRDHVGSGAAATDAAGQPAPELRTLPFGAPLGEATATADFTGKQRDATGLHYFGARHYGARAGRFVEADPILSPDEAPYAYARGNPLRYTDPTGKFAGVDDATLTLVGGGILLMAYVAELQRTGDPAAAWQAVVHAAQAAKAETLSTFHSTVNFFRSEWAGQPPQHAPWTPPPGMLMAASAAAEATATRLPNSLAANLPAAGTIRKVRSAPLTYPDTQAVAEDEGWDKLPPDAPIDLYQLNVPRLPTPARSPWRPKPQLPHLNLDWKDAISLGVEMQLGPPVPKDTHLYRATLTVGELLIFSYPTPGGFRFKPGFQPPVIDLGPVGGPENLRYHVPSEDAPLVRIAP